MKNMKKTIITATLAAAIAMSAVPAQANPAAFIAPAMQMFSQVTRMASNQQGYGGQQGEHRRPHDQQRREVRHELSTEQLIRGAMAKMGKPQHAASYGFNIGEVPAAARRAGCVVVATTNVDGYAITRRRCPHRD